MEIFSHHPHFRDAREVCYQLNQAGYQAYLAGGCVRDALLGHHSHDFDVATNARPEEIEELFPKSLPVGKQFGVVILPFAGFQVEVATFRLDGEYQDGRHPDQVTYSTPDEDARRRDFTVNALFYDLKEEKVIDFVGGIADLDRRVLRTVGDPQKRFAEDRLRILRAVRIASQLGFEIERETFQAVKDWAKEVCVVSQERVTAELKKMLSQENRVQALHDLQVSGLAQEILPELEYFSINHEMATRKTKHLAQLLGEESRPGVLLSLLLWQEIESLRGELVSADDWAPLVKGLVELILRRLKCSNQEISETVFVLTHYRELLEVTESDDFKPYPRTHLPRIDVGKLLLLDRPEGLSLLDFAMAVSAQENMGQEQLLFLHQEYLGRIDPKPAVFRILG